MQLKFKLILIVQVDIKELPRTKVIVHPKFTGSNCPFYFEVTKGKQIVPYVNNSTVNKKVKNTMLADYEYVNNAENVDTEVHSSEHIINTWEKKANIRRVNRTNPAPNIENDSPKTI